MRKRQLYANTFFSVINQLAMFICGFIVPRFMLKQYGSEVNGLVSSITQFLGFISMLDLGVGAVVQSTLYKPLAEKNNEKISLIFNSAKKFFQTIALILIGYTVVLCIVYPLFINRDFDTVYTVSLILIISISSFSQYYFAVPHQLLLNADQRIYIQCCIQTVTVVLNAVISVLLISRGCSVQIVKLVSSIVFLIRPVFLSVYVKNHYMLDYSIKSDKEQIEQKWNGMAQHCATVVMNNTDVIILSMFSSLSNVSIYSVYNLVLNSIKQFMTVLSNSFMALFGDIWAKKETSLMNETFDLFEWLMHTAVVFIFSLTIKLIVPFVKIYTDGINDANYDVPIFALLMCIAYAVYCVRIPYNTIICAACHYRETQWSAVIEMLLNIGISLILVNKFGIVGVAAGTIAAMTYRTLYFVFYLKKNILIREMTYFIKHFLTDGVQMALIFYVFSFIEPIAENYLQWLKLALIYAVIAVLVILAVNFLLYRIEMEKIIKKIFSKF